MPSAGTCLFGATNLGPLSILIQPVRVNNFEPYNSANDKNCAGLQQIENEECFKGGWEIYCRIGSLLKLHS